MNTSVQACARRRPRSPDNLIKQINVRSGRNAERKSAEPCGFKPHVTGFESVLRSLSCSPSPSPSLIPSSLCGCRHRSARMPCDSLGPILQITADCRQFLHNLVLGLKGSVRRVHLNVKKRTFWRERNNRKSYLTLLLPFGSI